MSRTQPTSYEQAMLMFGCDYCGTPAGSWCMAQGALDEFVRNLHAPRYDKVRDVQELSGVNAEVANQLRVKTEALRQLTALRDKLMRGEHVTRDDLELALTVLRRG